MARLSKNMRVMLKNMDGHEMYFRDWGIIGLEYPYVWYHGEKIYFGQERWRQVYDEYWNNPDNEGYWLKQEARREFGG